MAGTDGGLTLAPPAIPFGLVTIGTKHAPLLLQRVFFFFFFWFSRFCFGAELARFACARGDIEDGKRREMVMKENKKSLTRQYIHFVRVIITWGRSPY